MDKLISIIIPFYNAEKYIGKCLESVVGQTYRNLQIILINDGSTDTSLKICKEFAQKDDRIEIYCQKNKGVSMARNLGLSKATGEYVAWIDADDYVSSKFVELLYKIAEENNAEIVQCKHKRVYADDINFSDDASLCYVESNKVLHEYLQDKYDNISIYLWDKLVKRKLYSDVIFPNRTNSEERTVIYLLLLKCKKYIYTNAILYAYRMSEYSLTRGKIGVNYVQSGIDAECERLAYFKELNNKHLLESARIGFCKVMVMSYCRWRKYIGNDTEQLKKIYTLFIEELKTLDKSKLNTKNRYAFCVFKKFPSLYYNIIFRFYEYRKVKKEKNE